MPRTTLEGRQEYNRSEIRKAVAEKYRQSEKGKATRKVIYDKRQADGSQKAAGKKFRESPKYRPLIRRCHTALKLEILSHYGKDGKLLCSWPDCEINDLDLLTLDHINNDGALEKRGTGAKIYYRLRREGLPDGFQTLCWNHQWKKELERRRDAPPRRYGPRT